MAVKIKTMVPQASWGAISAIEMPASSPATNTAMRNINDGAVRTANSHDTEFGNNFKRQLVILSSSTENICRIETPMKICPKQDANNKRSATVSIATEYLIAQFDQL
jgi:hypothetical protein